MSRACVCFYVPVLLTVGTGARQEPVSKMDSEELLTVKVKIEIDVAEDMPVLPQNPLPAARNEPHGK